MNRFWFGVFVLISLNCHADVKEYHAVRTSVAPRIDGELRDACWMEAPFASEFITNSPQFGFEASLCTDVKMVYDDNAIYIIAYMYDTLPSTMLCPLTERDKLKAVETFFLGIDTYNDDLNAYRFEVSICNVQADGRFSRSNLDYSWDAVWQSATMRTDDGWIAELRIPYSALRFPERQVQDWGIQFGRIIARLGEVVSWSPVNPDIDGLMTQWGNARGIMNIKPPVRLSLSPYVSFAFQQEPATSGYSERRSVNGGLDLKYGINESFTLDMTLIPDFGQVQSDRQVLNLSAFETQFDEKRPFFTEGTELFRPGEANFRDGELFYSRRIGGTPSGYYSVASQISENEEVIQNPSETQLYNATKITGRTNGGLGLGFFNAVAAPASAIIRHKETGEQREIETSALTNYNVVVFDQSLKNNSKLSFINLSTLREGSATDANVSSMVYDVRLMQNTYSLAGFANYSARYNKHFAADPTEGYYYNFMVRKVGGKLNFDFFNSAMSKNYNQTDLGYQRSRNEMSNFAGIIYKNSKTKGGPLLNWNSYFSVNYTSRLEPFTYQDIQINSGFNCQFRNLWYAGMYVNGKPTDYYDFYEPRIDGAKYYRPGYQFGGIYINTDDRKKVYVNASIGYAESPVPDDPYKEASYEVNIKASDRLAFSCATTASKDKSNFGWVDDDGTVENIVFGRRNVTTISNEAFAKFSFSSRMNVAIRCRHYWSKAMYVQYYHLLNDGTLADTVYDGNADVSYNQFNIDMIFNWEFAPGSFITAAWKNSISQADALTHQNYFSNIDKTYEAPKSNMLSLKLIYYLDYHSLRKKR